MSRPPAVQFYCKDWIAKTLGLPLDVEGAYIRLWCAARTQSDDWCSLPDDDRRLARIVGVSRKKWLQLRHFLVPNFFVVENGRLVNPRLSEEGENQRQRQAQASDAGRKSAALRGNDRSTTVPTNVQRPFQRTGNTDSDSSSSNATESTPESESNTPPRATPAAPKGAAFVRPSLAEVHAYCAERFAAGRRQVDPQAWLDHYTANGWRVGRNAMKDWRAAVRTWERGEFQSAGRPTVSGKIPHGMLAQFVRTQEIKP